MLTFSRGSVLLFALVSGCLAAYVQEIREVDWSEPENIINEEDPLAIAPGALDIEGNLFDPLRVKKIIEVSNGAKWGTWGDATYCPDGSYASGYAMKIEPKQGSGDDTSLNGIRIICKDKNGDMRGEAASSIGHWGNWGDNTLCREHKHRSPDYLTAFKLQVEAPQGWRHDDTAANYVEFKCRGLCQSCGKEYDLVTPPGHGYWGQWGAWSASCAPGTAICGIKTKVEPYNWWHAAKDDTALNSAVFYCCR